MNVQVLSVVQVAKAVAASYPYVPDVLAILREGVRLAAESDAAPAGAAGMGAGATTATGKQNRG